MLDRKDVKEGCEYRIDGKPWFVFMIHKSGNGEAVSITSEGYSDSFYRRWQDGLLEMKRMQMRVFQRSSAPRFPALTNTTESNRPSSNDHEK